MIVPKFENLSVSYPTTSDYKSVLREINPALENDPAFQNTCVMRVSKALNYNKGHEIPKRVGLLTVKGVDGKRYAVRVREMKNFLQIRYAPPKILTASSFRCY